MKKIILLSSIVFIMVFCCNNVFSFDLNGCWKAENIKSNDRVVCFSKDRIQGINLDAKAIYTINKHDISVQIPSTWATIHITNDGDDTIYIEGDMVLKKIKYIRISPEEADKLLKKDQSGK